MTHEEAFRKEMLEDTFEHAKSHMLSRLNNVCSVIIITGFDNDYNLKCCGEREYLWKTITAAYEMLTKKLLENYDEI